MNGGAADTSGHPGATLGIIVVPVLKEAAEKAHPGPAQVRRSPQARLEEATGLAEAIDIRIVHREIVPVATPRPATLLGSGKIEELRARVEETEAEVVFVDHPLTPVQQRNLERALNAKVLDRTGLILEIFGRRASTREGVLQVDLAHLEYQRSRLVRSWTHLERQRGGAGFLGGPGETQIEADRRQLQERIVRLRRELEQVKRTRNLHRAKRRKVPYPVVAIVGYTNAGKSTLFNRLTGAGVDARDMLFATLDPTLRQLRLPNGTRIILSDTVGFISNLPTHLVAAFRATLEEVVEADLILHLRDMSDPDSAAQAADVSSILRDLGIDSDDRDRVLEVWNKADLVDGEPGFRQDGIPVISALTGAGIDHLLETIERRITGGLETFPIRLRPEEVSLIDWIYRNCRVLERTDREDGGIELVARSSTIVRRELQRRLREGAG